MRRWHIWENGQGINTFPLSEGVSVLTTRNGETRIYGFVAAEEF